MHFKRYTKFDVYKAHCYFVQYNDNYFRVLLNKFQREKGFINNTKAKTTKDEIERISLSRTKRNIKELALCNDFQYFSTITIKSDACDRYSLVECQKILRQSLKKIKRNHNNFAYLFITEKHKDGAFHFHGLTRDIPLYINSYGYYSCSILDDVGFNSHSQIRDYNKCCNYITKYITKDCIRNEHNQIYISSRGLKKADKYEIPIIDLDEWGFENDFVKIRDFRPDELSKNDFFQILGLYNPQNLKKI